jgi:hypothetical protein
MAWQTARSSGRGGEVLELAEGLEVTIGTSVLMLFLTSTDARRFTKKWKSEEFF